MKTFLLIAIGALAGRLLFESSHALIPTLIEYGVSQEMAESLINVGLPVMIMVLGVLFLLKSKVV